MVSGGWVYHRNRARSLERDPTWRQHFVPARAPLNGTHLKTAKADRNRPPNKQPKKR